MPIRRQKNDKNSLKTADSCGFLTFFTHRIGDKIPFLSKNTYKYIPQPKGIQNSSKTSIKTQQHKNKKICDNKYTQQKNIFHRHTNKNYFKKIKIYKQKNRIIRKYKNIHLYTKHKFA